MELNKKTEQYKLEDLYQEKNWKIVGTVYNNTNGTVSMSFTVTDDLNESVGAMNYNKAEDGTINVNYDIKEDNRHEFTAYVNILIDNILSQFK